MRASCGAWWSSLPPCSSLRRSCPTFDTKESKGRADLSFHHLVVSSLVSPQYLVSRSSWWMESRQNWSCCGTSTRWSGRRSTTTSFDGSLTASVPSATAGLLFLPLDLQLNGQVHNRPVVAELKRGHHLPHAQPALGELHLSHLQVVGDQQVVTFLQ